MFVEKVYFLKKYGHMNILRHDFVECLSLWLDKINISEVGHESQLLMATVGQNLFWYNQGGFMMPIITT